MAVARFYDNDRGEWVLLAAGRDGESGASAWGDLTGKPDAFPPADHTHTWNDVSAKPSSFPPSAHSHVVADVDGLQSALDGKAPVSHGHTASQISDATTVGRNVLKATDAAAARSAVGAGTSNLALGTTSSTAAAGNHTHSEYATTTQVDAKADASHTHTKADITDLEGISTTAMAHLVVKRTGSGNINLPTTPSGPNSATSKSYVDARTPEIRTVSSPEQATSPGVLYVVMEG